MKLNKGFTLIELLIVVAIMVSVGSIIAGVIASTLRNSKKADNIEKVRQSGNHALSQIAKNIEYAKSFDGLIDTSGGGEVECPPSATPTDCKSITITLSDGKQLEYECTPPSPPSGGIFTVEDVDSGTENSIVDTSLINITDCSIKCIRDTATTVPIIEVSFDLQYKGDQSLVEYSAQPTKFKTSVVMRNHN